MRPFLTIIISTVLAAMAMTIAAPRDARADTPPFTLGRTGQVVIDDVIGFRTGAPALLGAGGLAVGAGVERAGPIGGPSLGGIIGYGYSAGGSNAALFMNDVVWVAPAVDVFVGRRVSLGMSVGVSHARSAVIWASSRSLGSTTSLAAMPRIGYALPVGHGFSLWPRVGVGTAHSRVIMTDISGSNEQRASRWVGGVDVGLIYQAMPYVFVSMRPELTLAYTTAPTAGASSFSVALGAAVGLGVAL